MKVVLDTNILVSALLWRGTPYRCLLAIEAGLVELIISPPILEEFRRILIAKFRHTQAEADGAVAFLRATATLVEVPETLHGITEDPEDDKFVEAAQVAGVDYLVSRDRHLLTLGVHAGIPVIRARTLLDLLVPAGP